MSVLSLPRKSAYQCAQRTVTSQIQLGSNYQSGVEGSCLIKYLVSESNVCLSGGGAWQGAWVPCAVHSNWLERKMWAIDPYLEFQFLLARFLLRYWAFVCEHKDFVIFKVGKHTFQRNYTNCLHRLRKMVWKNRGLRLNPVQDFAKLNNLLEFGCFPWLSRDLELQQ